MVAKLLQHLKFDCVFSKGYFTVPWEVENSVNLDHQSFFLAVAFRDCLAIELGQHDVFFDALSLAIEDGFGSVDTLDCRENFLLKLGNCGGLLRSQLFNGYLKLPLEKPSVLLPRQIYKVQA